MTISLQTARDISFAHREIEAAEGLIVTIKEARSVRQPPDSPDAFGRRQYGSANRS
jgi:hypothetical protein